jgi:hypothetical protein
MPVGWLDAVTDTTIWGRVSGEEAFGPVGLRVEVDGQLQGFGRAGQVDPEGGPWRFAIHHALRHGQLVSVYAVGVERELLLLLEGSPRVVPAGTAPRGELEAVTATQVTGWAVDDDHDGPITVACTSTAASGGASPPTWSGPTWRSRGWAARVRHPHALEPGQQVEAWAFGVRSDGSRDQRQVLLPGSPLTTPEGATLEQPPATATSARLRAAGPAGVRADGWAETTYAVESVGQLGGPVLAGTVVLSTPASGASAAALAALERGNVDGTTPFHRRNPRTAVGATADGRLLIVTVDGRQPGHSVDHHGARRHDRQPRLRPPGAAGPDRSAGPARAGPAGPAARGGHGSRG